MKHFAWIALAASLLVTMPTAGDGRQAVNLPANSPLSGKAATAARQSTPVAATPSTYNLSPERRAKAIAYSRSLYTVYFVGILLSLGIYFFLWRAGISATFSKWARRVSRGLLGQCLIFVPLFTATVALLMLPLHYYSGYVLEHRFGLATQGIAFWFSDWGKSLGITTAVVLVVVWAFIKVVHRSPRHWWFFFWLASIPLTLAFILIEPYLIEPLFYRFTPLAQTHPALVGRIEAMMNHAGLSVPPSHIFEMNASSRTNAIDAYVSGLGSSKRVVVWDTTIKDLGPDELLLVLGHETGHYVLHHIPKEFALDEGVALVFFYLGFLVLKKLMTIADGRKGAGEIGDLASLPLVLIVLTLVAFFSDPIVDGISRHYEHQADQFGLEVAYGIVPDPNAAEVRSLEALGDIDLSDPDPGPFIKFWLYTHPPLDERIRFAAQYKPWAQGKPMELLPQKNEGKP